MNDYKFILIEQK